MKEDKELRAQLDKIEKLLLNGSGSGASTSSSSSKSSKISEKVLYVQYVYVRMCACSVVMFCVYAPIYVNLTLLSYSMYL